MSVGLYAVFLAMQISRHRNYFMAPASLEPTEAPTGNARPATKTARCYNLMLLLVAHLLPVVILSGQIAVPSPTPFTNYTLPGLGRGARICAGVVS